MKTKPGCSSFDVRIPEDGCGKLRYMWDVECSAVHWKVEGYDKVYLKVKPARSDVLDEAFL